MSVSRGLFLAVSLAVAAQMPIDVRAQTAEQDAISIETQNARMDALDAKRAKLPPSLHALEWQIAFLGDNTRPPSAHYLGRLIGEYEKATPFIKTKILNWVNTLAAELVQRGDGHRLLVLASHYVKKDPSLSLENQFAAYRSTLGGDTKVLGKIIQSTLATMQPDEQWAFRKSLCEAIGQTLVTFDDKPEPQFLPRFDFTTAILGFDLLKNFAEDRDPEVRRDTLPYLDKYIKTFEFNATGLEPFWTQGGNINFQKATDAFLSIPREGLSYFLMLSPRTTADAGQAMRKKFALTFAMSRNYEYGLYVFDLTHRLAVEQRLDGRYETLAQQMISPEWDKALSAVLTPERMTTIYFRHYFEGNDKRPKSYTVARQKELTPDQQADMERRFQYLLGNAVSKPKIYYQILRDFENDTVFQKALAVFQPKIKPRHVLGHFKYLGGEYINSADMNDTIYSNLQLQKLIRAYAQAKISAVDFQTSIMKMAVDAAGDETKDYQIAKLVHNAVTSGWSHLVDDKYIAQLRPMLKGANAQDSLDSVLRVQADQRALKKRWEAVVTPTVPAKK